MGQAKGGLHPHITHPRLQPLADDLWTVRAPLKLGGLEIGTRMTVARLADGSLWLHSPVRPTADLTKELDALGPVRHIVAPSKMHHLFLMPFAEKYPEARTYGVPGLREKVPTLRIDEVLSERPPADWCQLFELRLFDAAPALNEMLFLHHPSKTLLLTDLCFNVRQVPGVVERVFHSVWGTWQRFGPSRVVRAVTRDKVRARKTIDRVLRWDFERVSVCHGEVLERRAQELMREAFESWLPKSQSRTAAAAAEHG